MAGWKFAVFTALNWGGWEFIRAALFPLKFPWMTAGLAMGPNRLLPWIGVYGVGIVVLLLVAFAVARLWKVALIPAAVLLGAIVASVRHPAPVPDNPDQVKVAGLQKEGVSLREYLNGTRTLPSDIPSSR